MTETDEAGLLDHDLVRLAGIGAAAWYLTGGTIPDWGVLAGSVLVVAGIGALFASGKIHDLLPEDPRVHLVRINAKSDEPVAHWSLTPDKFADMQVEWGPLYPYEHATEEAYECYAYDADRNVAVGTWRRSVPGHQLVGRHDTDDVLDVVGELRGNLEPDARRGQRIRQALPSIARTIKFEAMEAQNAALDPGRPMDTGQRSPDDVLRDELPPNLLPGRLQNGDLADLLEQGAADDAGDDWGDGLEIVMDEDTEALEPIEANGSDR
jgi:hypothetical protein